MATFYNISEDEMREFLEAQGFSQMKLPRTKELVFGKRMDQDNIALSLRVYTGIDPNGSSREAGTDAIRVVLFMRSRDGSIFKLGGSKRVHRVLFWKKNLQKRLDSWLDSMPKHKCSKCGSPMLPRKGQFGKFLGCSRYPQCKNTLKIETPA
jgi:hypothetical protein